MMKIRGDLPMAETQKMYTTEDIRALPQEERAELIDGRMYRMEAPGRIHQKLDDKGCQGAPDWVIEVMSQSSRKMDCLIKLDKYRSAGVREYWIVDPEKRTVAVHRFEADDYVEYSFADSVPAGIDKDLHIDLTQVDMD